MLIRGQLDAPGSVGTTIGRLLATAVLGTLIAIAGVVAPAAAAPVDQGGGYSYEIVPEGVVYSSPIGRYTVLAPYFDGKHRALGGGTGALGYPAGDQVQEGPGYWYQKFEGGILYASPWGTHAVLGDRDRSFGYYDFSDMAGRHIAEGGGSGFGYPMADAVRQGSAYLYQQFEGGYLYASPSGQHAVAGVLCCDGTRWFGGTFADEHNRLGGGTGLGYPVNPGWRQSETYSFQPFERGVIYRSPQGTFTVPGSQVASSGSEVGSIAFEHRIQGGGIGLGYPRGNPVGQGGSYFYQLFERGIIYTHREGRSAPSTWTVTGDYLRTHALYGGGTGRLGYPVSNYDYTDTGGTQQFFEGGEIRIERGVVTVRLT